MGARGAAGRGAAKSGGRGRMTAPPAGSLDLIRGWLARRLDRDALAWLDAQLAKASGSDRDLYLAIGLAPRRLGKADLALDESELAAADAARAGWNPAGWSVDQAGRAAILLAAACADADAFPAKLEQLCNTADVRELIAFYQGLPLYPGPERYIARAAEGARTNMKAVFEAVAHRNPYPAEQFSGHVWNQLVLKAVFVGSALAPIVGFDQRRNPELARTLIDYAHERWAAKRDVTPELWRAVGPFAAGDMLHDLRRVLDGGSAAEREAAALALHDSPDPAARRVLDSVPDLRSAIEAGRVSWETVFRSVQKPQ